MKKVELGLRTKSIWSEPGSNFYRFLKRIENSNLPKTLAILGCADGTYVLPAARRGFSVMAIDNDPVSLYGGNIQIGQKNIEVMGLRERLKVEDLANQASVVEGDFISHNHEASFSGVFTSGSIHYEQNSKYTLEQIVRSIQSYVAKDGILYLEYIHPSKNFDFPERRYLLREQLAHFFLNNMWKVTSNKRKTYVEEANPRNPNTHTITWGRLYAQRIE